MSIPDAAPPPPAWLIPKIGARPLPAVTGVAVEKDPAAEKRLTSYVTENKSGIFFNITWGHVRGKCLPDPEFFPSVLSFFLEFRVFS